MSLKHIVPGLAKIEAALNLCLSALNSEHPVSVSALTETLGNCAKGLKQLQPIISQLVKAEDMQSSVIATVRDNALQLLFSLDETQAAYKPCTHGDIVELVHELLELVGGGESLLPPASEETSQAKHLPPEFREAMHRYIEIAERLGDDHPETKHSFMVAMHLAPDWFRDDYAKMIEDRGLLPQSSGYLADGTPVYSLEAIAEKAGMTIEQAEQELHMMLSVRQELGFSLDGVINDSSIVHPKQ